MKISVAVKEQDLEIDLPPSTDRRFLYGREECLADAVGRPADALKAQINVV